MLDLRRSGADTHAHGATGSFVGLGGVVRYAYGRTGQQRMAQFGHSLAGGSRQLLAFFDAFTFGSSGYADLVHASCSTFLLD